MAKPTPIALHKPIQGTFALGNLVLDSLAALLWAEARPSRNNNDLRIMVYGLGQTDTHSYA